MLRVLWWIFLLPSRYLKSDREQRYPYERAYPDGGRCWTCGTYCEPDQTECDGCFVEG